MLLYQQQPVFIYNTFDIFSWLFMQTGIPQWLLRTRYFLLFDLAYYTAPLSLLFAFYKKPKSTSFAAVYVLSINWIYLQCYFLYPISSYTIFIVGLIFPAAFTVRNDKTFILLFAALRYFFLYFFLSAGIWKIVNGGAFNLNELSAILLDQHKEMLTGSPHYWLRYVYQYVISHRLLSYMMYITVMLMELSFVIGFFTRKFDKFLIILYFIFLLADYFVMRIPYYETLPFLLTLYLQPVKFSERKA